MSTDKQLVALIDKAKSALQAVVGYYAKDGSGDNRDLLTERQIAERLQVSLSTLQRERKKGRYPFFFKEGGRWMTTGAAYAKWLDTREKRAGVK